MKYLVYTPDAVYDDGGELERAIGGELIDLRVEKWGSPAASNRVLLAKSDYKRFMDGRRLVGRIFGTVGLGPIGTATALRARAFGMSVMTFDPYLARGQELALGIERVESLDELLGTADVISLHLPLNAQ